MDIQQGQGDNGQVPSDAEHVGDEQKVYDSSLNSQRNSYFNTANILLFQKTSVSFHLLKKV